MSRLTAFSILIAAVVVAGGASAQDLPSQEVLRDIVAKLRARPISSGSTFEPAAAPDGACAMQRHIMTLANGSPAARRVSVLLDRKPDDVSGPIVLMAVLPRLAVDADGSPRSYHPDDPDGQGVCKKDPPSGPAGADHYSGVCALDNFTSGDIQVFKGSQKLRGAERAAEWKTIWPLIRDHKLASIDLKQKLPIAPDGYYFFYLKDEDVSAFFKDDVIPRTADGYPCVQDASSPYPGYFVAKTTLQQQDAARNDVCVQSRFIDAEQIPYIVVPDDAYGNARIGDIVVARLDGPSGGGLIYGIVADTGSPEAFGEASIAFNRALRRKTAPILSGRDVLAMDIHASVAILILGGSKAALNGDYSRGNIEKVGREQFEHWNNDKKNPTGRFDACVRALRGRH
jgi:hypothetical protein